jgi:hypothetical protein
MSTPGNTDTSAAAPSYLGVLAGPRAAGHGVRGPALYNNTTPGAFVNGQAVGLFAISAAETEGKPPHQGWVEVKMGTGPVTAINPVVTGTSGFGNNETVTISGGQVNATGLCVANAAGGLASITLANGGYGFTNTASLVYQFNRELHMGSILVTAGSGYNNTDYIVASNGTINAVATLTTNSTGGFQNTTINMTNAGIWANTTTNAQVKFTVYAANGAASNGSGAVFTANLASKSTGGSFTATLGGRSGRQMFETLIPMKISGAANTSSPFYP